MFAVVPDPANLHRVSQSAIEEPIRIWFVQYTNDLLCYFKVGQCTAYIIILVLHDSIYKGRPFVWRLCSVFSHYAKRILCLHEQTTLPRLLHLKVAYLDPTFLCYEGLFDGLERHFSAILAQGRQQRHPRKGDLEQLQISQDRMIFTTLNHPRVAP